MQSPVSVASKFQAFNSVLKIKDRRWRLRKYEQCFVGDETVVSLVREGICGSPDEAVKLGQTLLEAGYFFHVTKAHPFENKFYFYRLNSEKLAEALTLARQEAAVIKSAPKSVFDRIETEYFEKCYKDFRRMALIEDRKWAGFVIPACFEGNQVVSELVKNQLVSCSSEALECGLLLQSKGFIKHVARCPITKVQKKFADKKNYYQFVFPNMFEKELGKLEDRSVFRSLSVSPRVVGQEAFQVPDEPSVNFRIEESVLRTYEPFSVSTEVDKEYHDDSDDAEAPSSRPPPLPPKKRGEVSAAAAKNLDTSSFSHTRKPSGRVLLSDQEEDSDSGDELAEEPATLPLSFAHGREKTKTLVSQSSKNSGKEENPSDGAASAACVGKEENPSDGAASAACVDYDDEEPPPDFSSDSDSDQV
jgi:hypothetical protein